MENKKDILESLFETLTRTRKWSDEIAEMIYNKDKNGNEEVLVRLYEGNAEMFIDVTGDSGMALIKDVIAALKSVDMGLLKGDAHMKWMDQLEILNSTTNAISKSNDIEEQRNEYIQFNLAFYESVKMFGLENTITYFQYCPMANNDKGAYWLSSKKDILNPYFGDAMLSCGETKETIK